MIIKGKPAGNVGYWSKHLMNDETNERVTVRAIDGLTADDLPGALREMEAMASGSRSQGNFMYQANINPLEHERLTPEQWTQAVDTLEKNLGLEGHARVVVEHEKHGRQHYHIIWNRVDPETMKVADMGGNWPTHERTSRELEERFGLTPTPARDPNAPRPHELWEERAAERSGIDPKAMKEELTELWRASRGGREFAAMVEERGYKLAQGDRRDFCIVDEAGAAHSLARRLDGVKTAEVRAHMADIDREGLPTVAEARAEQRAKHGNENMAATPEPAPTIDPEIQAEVRRQSALEREQMKADRAARAEPVSASHDSAAGATHGPRGGARMEGAAGAAGGAAIGVADAMTGVVEQLADFVANMLTGGGPPPPPRDPETVEYDQIIAQRRAAAALENIAEDLNAGKNLSAADVRSLPTNTLENIHQRGDDYLRYIIDRMAAEQRERDEERYYGRERER